MPTAPVNGIDLYYEEHGSGPPLVLITGIEDNATAWGGMIPTLAEHFRVVTFDNRGAGRSAAPHGPYTIPQMAADTLGLLDHLGLARAHLVGHSMGGLIAQEFALAYPNRLDRLVCLATLARLTGVFRGWLEFFKEGYQKAVEPRTFALWGMTWAFTPALMSQPEKTIALLDSLMANPYPITVQGFVGQADAMLAFDGLDRLPQIAAPTLALVGAEDILTPPCCAEEIAAAIPGARMRLLPRGGHCMTIEYPDEVSQALLAFLAG
jgi:3-oxoadipate enol-lactonase